MPGKKPRSVVSKQTIFELGRRKAVKEGVKSETDMVLSSPDTALIREVPLQLAPG
jgi:hypothetical protein